MTLFPYARDVEYIDGELSFVLTFFNGQVTTDMEIKMGLDTELGEMIQGLLDQMEEV